MIFTKIKDSFKYQKPIVTILLAASCLITTIPQIFLGAFYNHVTGSPYSHQLYWAFTLPSFSHAPQMLITHLTGNLAVLLLFGMITEQIIGSNRFALITLITLIGTTLLDVFHGIGITHGASGIFWGYHLTAFFVITVIFEQSKNKWYKEVYFWAGLFFFTFDLIVIPVLEVVIQHRKFFDNFGQTLHLFSIFLLTPYIVLKRTLIEKNTMSFLSGTPIQYQKKGMSIVLLSLILLLNVAATVYAVLLSS